MSTEWFYIGVLCVLAVLVAVLCWRDYKRRHTVAHVHWVRPETACGAVEAHPAWWFNCERCSEENFQRAAWRKDEDGILSRIIPREVECRYCGCNMAVGNFYEQWSDDECANPEDMGGDDEQYLGARA